MLTSIFSSLAMLGAAGSISGASAEDSAVPPAETETVATADDRYSRLTVPVTIDGEPFRFMVDTGSQATVITQRVTERLQLTPDGNALIVGMASSVPAPTVELNGMQLGTRMFDGLTAPILDARNVGADGIVGLDSLQDLRVLLNFREETIALVDANKRQSRRGYEIIVRARRQLGQLIITDAIVDGVKVAVIIDTGAQGTMGNLALKNRLRARTSQQVTATDVNGVSITGDLRFARSVKIQDLEINQVPITYADTPAFKALGYGSKPAISLGMRHLRMFDRVAIDFKKRQVMFDLPRSAGRRSAWQNTFPAGWNQ